MRDGDRMVRLDDLFDEQGGLEEFGSTVRRGASSDGRPAIATARWWVATGFTAIALSAALYAGLSFMLRIAVPYPLLLTTVLAVLVLRRVLRDISARAEHPLPDAVTGHGIAATPPGFVGPDDRETWLRQSVGPTDGVRFAVGRWDDRFSWSERDPTRFVNLVVPRLRELTDERLRQRHGLTVASDPRRAQDLLGRELWDLLHVPLTRKPDPRDVASIVARLESL